MMLPASVSASMTTIPGPATTAKRPQRERRYDGVAKSLGDILRLDSIMNATYFHSKVAENLPEPQKESLGSPIPLSVATNAPARILSHALFRGHREVLIEHGEREYRLRVTASGMILTA